ncbi:unnamed protein product [Ceutorhynchus assimilis]|uniref:Cilia- and flagella-associated protein 69 ARM repeats domain-containing protein n=1 Tax=Ceutorhynchus assimilis TaxID=467358 RepID=A0A9N9QPA7_9CUCU|nr:unnamed protein product [Ceutorhynchus assimilis]
MMQSKSRPPTKTSNEKPKTAIKMQNKKDCSYLLMGSDPTRILQKISAISSYDANNKGKLERLVKIINEYFIISSKGFFVKHLSKIMSLLGILLEINTKQACEEQLNRFLELCSIPPIMTKSGEVLEYDKMLKDYFSWMGFAIICLEEKKYRKKMTDAIYSLLTKQCPDKREYLSLTVRIEKASKSYLPYVLADLLKAEEEDIYLEILQIVAIFIKESTKTCEIFLMKDAVNTIITRLEPNWRNRLPNVKPKMPTGLEEVPMVQTIFLILKTLLERANRQVMRPPMKFAFWSLQWSLRLFTIKEIGTMERNNVLCLLLLILDIYPNGLSGNTSFSYGNSQTYLNSSQELKDTTYLLLSNEEYFTLILYSTVIYHFPDIAMLAVSKDVTFSQNWISGIEITTSPEDHCFISLLLICLFYLPNTIAGAKVIEECRVIMGLLKIIGNNQALKWRPLHLCFLVKLALNILYKIVPASTEEFIENGGPLLILQLLNRAQEYPDMYNYDIVLRSIELLAELSHKIKTIRDSIAYNGGAFCILHLCQNWLSSTKTLNEEYQVLLGMGISLLQEICSIVEVGNKRFQNYLSCLVLPLIVEYMKRYVNPDEIEQLQNPKLIIICVSYVWTKITCSKINSEEFVSMGGVFLMLDIAQVRIVGIQIPDFISGTISCLPVKLVVLGALIDLCEQVECVPYLITWRRNGQGIVPFLMETFRQENKQLVVRTDENGIMSSHLYPLMGEVNYYETYCKCKNHFGNAAIADLFVSCRPKVYCLLQILNYKQAETVEIANEFYKIYGEELSILDKVTYVLAENFLSVKLGEVWKEIEADLKREDLEPIPSDAAILQIMIEITDKWAQDFHRMQKDIVRGYMDKQRKKEESLYRKLKEAHVAEAWNALTEIEYIARCSQIYFRLGSTVQRQKQIDESLEYNEENGPLHRTLQSGINVTCLHNQDVTISSKFDEDSRDSDQLALVSPMEFDYPLHVSVPFDEPCGEYLSEDEIPKFET